MEFPLYSKTGKHRRTAASPSSGTRASFPEENLYNRDHLEIGEPPRRAARVSPPDSVGELCSCSGNIQENDKIPLLSQEGRRRAARRGGSLMRSKSNET